MGSETSEAPPKLVVWFETPPEKEILDLVSSDILPDPGTPVSSNSVKMSDDQLPEGWEKRMSRSNGKNHTKLHLLNYYVLGKLLPLVHSSVFVHFFYRKGILPEFAHQAGPV